MELFGTLHLLTFGFARKELRHIRKYMCVAKRKFSSLTLGKYVQVFDCQDIQAGFRKSFLQLFQLYILF